MDKHGLLNQDGRSHARKEGKTGETNSDIEIEKTDVGSFPCFFNKTMSGWIQAVLI